MPNMPKIWFAAVLALAASMSSAYTELNIVGSRQTASPEEIESEKLARKMAKEQAQIDEAVNRWLDAALQAQAVPPVPPVKASPQPGDSKCRMVPDDRGYSTLGTGHSPAEALANAKGRVPPSCSATGKTLCDRYADMSFASNKDFLAAFKGHMREPKWKHSCSAYYTCSHHQKQVCEGGPRLGAGASKQ